MIRLVLFDIDGTLIHTNGAGVKAFGRALATQFQVSDATAHVTFAGRTDSGLAREFFREHGIEPSSENFRLFFDCYAHWLQHLLSGTGGEVCPGVWRTLLELQNLPSRPTLGLLTGNIRLGAEIKLRHFQLWERFQTGAFADDHEDRGRIAAAAMERGRALLGRNLSGAETLVIGDTPLDIACARAIGARVLAVATGGSTLAELQAHQPDWAAPNLERFDLGALCRD